MTSDPEPDKHSLYIKYYEAVEKVKQANSEAFDRAILTLSSAGLALSLSFFKFVIPAEVAHEISTIKFSWCAFLVAIISTTISFRVAQFGYDVAIKHAEKYYIDDDDSYSGKHNAPAAFSEFLNWVSAVAFVAAVVSLVLFIIRNV